MGLEPWYPLDGCTSQNNKRIKIMSNDYLTADELVDPGNYWWLPAFCIGKADVASNWVMICWHPNDDNHRSGAFVGPINPPTHIPVP